MFCKVDRSNIDFNCKVCGLYVTSHRVVSGVEHRNHCPNCLYSRHLDLFTAGDRLCACKGMMIPVGLTIKRTTDKYNTDASGELMLVHHCLDCGALSINRIAADDDPLKLWAIFQNNLRENNSNCVNTEGAIHFLQDEDQQLLQFRLFGRSSPAYPEKVHI